MYVKSKIKYRIYSFILKLIKIKFFIKIIWNNWNSTDNFIARNFNFISLKNVLKNQNNHDNEILYLWIGWYVFLYLLNVFNLIQFYQASQ